MRYSLIFSAFFLLSGAAFAGDCNKLCDLIWWSTTSDEEIDFYLEKEGVTGGDGVRPSPLSLVSSVGNVVAMKKLINKGAAVNHSLMHGWTPIYWASRSDVDAEVLRILISAGGSVVSYTYDGETPLTKAAVHGNLETIKIIVADGLIVPSFLDHLPEKGGSSLMRAARYQTPEVVNFLLDKGADPGLLDQRGKSAAYYAKGNRRLVDSDALKRLRN